VGKGKWGRGNDEMKTGDGRPKKRKKILIICQRLNLLIFNTGLLKRVVS
jgi:hypothetical protein